VTDRATRGCAATPTAGLLVQQLARLVGVLQQPPPPRTGTTCDI
jgi:hypothetical protein